MIASAETACQVRPLISLILCSRNDAYMGNSKWRLATTLEYVAGAVAELAANEEVEVIVTDWGSNVPLAQALTLSQTAATVVSFMHVPPALAASLQRDSPFPEVLALNAAARRARGQYIGRIDQDTLVGRRALELILNLCRGRLALDSPPELSLFFSNLRMVPYRFAASCPSIELVAHFVDKYGSQCPVELTRAAPFYCHSVGIWLLARALWDECEGYDESMIFMNGMEINMIARLMTKYRVVDLGRLTDYDFFHLEHYHPWQLRKSSVYRRENGVAYKVPQTFRPNGPGWGMADCALPIARAFTSQQANTRLPIAPTHWSSLIFTLMLMRMRLLAPIDAFLHCFTRGSYAVRRRASNTRRRFLVLRRETAGRSIALWPTIIWSLWKRSRGRGVA